MSFPPFRGALTSQKTEIGSLANVRLRAAAAFARRKNSMSHLRTKRWFAVTLTICLLGFATGHRAFAGAVETRTNVNVVQGSGTQSDLFLSLIVTWLSANFDLPATYSLPRVKVMSAAQIAAKRYGSVPLNRRREVVALYDDKHQAIYISESWTGRGPADISVVVHEMVHHLQNLDRRSYACPQAREKLAYAAQEKWLGLFGRSLASEFEIDTATLKLSMICM